MTEPECQAEGGTWVDYGDHCTGETPKSNLHDWMNYDLSVMVPIDGNPDDWHQTIFKDEDNVKVGSIDGQKIFLGMIPAGGTMEVTQSYHLIPTTGNWAQADTMTFDIEIYAEQLTGHVRLENKSGDPDWKILGGVGGDSIKADLTYNLSGPTFDYSLTGTVTKSSTGYSLIYYADPWPGNNLGALIGTGTSDGSGDIIMSGSTELNMDLPVWPSDQNYPEGAKIWLVPSDDYDTDSKSMTGWSPADYLFETGLIQYEDTDL